MAAFDARTVSTQQVDARALQAVAQDLPALSRTRPRHRHAPEAAHRPDPDQVISAVPIGYLGEHMQFDTTRSALGELVYRLKYRNGPLNDIVDTAVAFVNERWNGVIDCVVHRRHRCIGPSSPQC